MWRASLLWEVYVLRFEEALGRHSVAPCARVQDRQITRLPL
jgi:hypothetical protein